MSFQRREPVRHALETEDAYGTARFTRGGRTARARARADNLHENAMLVIAALLGVNVVLAAIFSAIALAEG